VKEKLQVWSINQKAETHQNKVRRFVPDDNLTKAYKLKAITLKPLARRVQGHKRKDFWVTPTTQKDATAAKGRKNGKASQTGPIPQDSCPILQLDIFWVAEARPLATHSTEQN
jgi:hypothetical protein